MVTAEDFINTNTVIQLNICIEKVILNNGVSDI